MKSLNNTNKILFIKTDINFYYNMLKQNFSILNTQTSMEDVEDTHVDNQKEYGM